MDYIRFGSGPKTLVMLPGVGDGLKTVRGMALPFAVLYRELTRDFTVYAFSRRRELPPHATTRGMAADLARAMERLGLSDAAVLGVSQGGMIAQWLAIDHPERVGRLVLAVTLARPNPTVRDVIARWTRMAERGDYAGILIDTAERSYSPRRARQARLIGALIGRLGKPKSFERFRIQAASCVTHDAWAELPRIACPTLVIGGTDDRIVTGEASGELAARIPGSRLYLYEGLGHGLYEEAPDFVRRVADFCR
ncbi:MAG: alpha/beta hydrolase [Oscillospiraceae bacterium]|nr:alpha/beta hydrolase [Oscillospiraceae bacterium]